jgi:hypothetical protein
MGMSNDARAERERSRDPIEGGRSVCGVALGSGAIGAIGAGTASAIKRGLIIGVDKFAKLGQARSHVKAP